MLLAAVTKAVPFRFSTVLHITPGNCHSMQIVAEIALQDRRIGVWSQNFHILLKVRTHDTKTGLLRPVAISPKPSQISVLLVIFQIFSASSCK